MSSQSSSSIPSGSENPDPDRALQVSEERLRQAILVAGVGFYEHDHRTDTLYWSPRLHEIYGVASDEPASVARFLAFVHPNDRSAVAAAIVLAHGAQGVGLFAVEHRIVRADGSVRWLIQRARTSFGGDADQRRPIRTIGAVADITERKAAEERLRESEARYERAIAGANDGIWEWDPKTGEDYLSPRWKQLLGYADAELANREESFFALIHEEDREPVAAAIRAHFDQRTPYDVELRLRCKNGDYRWFSSRGQAEWAADGSPVRMSGSITDIHARKRAEHELAELNRVLDQKVAERTEELVQLRLKLRALVAEITRVEERERRRLANRLHDFVAQAMTAARMNLSLYRQKAGVESNPYLQETQEQIDAAIEYTRRLMGELSPRGLYDLGLPAGLQWLADQMVKHGLRIELESLPLPAKIDEDIAALAFQCARELVWNVVKHAQTDRARIGAQLSHGMLTISVSDGGRGFDSQCLQSRPESNERFGLFSLRERLEAVGGSMTVASELGNGCKVTYTIPLAGQTYAVSPAAPRLQVNERAPTGAPWRILLVDDHAVVRQGLRRILDDHADLEVVGEAADGFEAVALAREIKPDAIIMDVHMPGMNGIDATRSIVREQPQTLVLGLSFATDSHVLQAMQAAGAYGCVTEERAAEEIYAVLANALASRQGSPAEVSRDTQAKSQPTKAWP